MAVEFHPVRSRRMSIFTLALLSAFIPTTSAALEAQRSVCAWRTLDGVQRQQCVARPAAEVVNAAAEGGLLRLAADGVADTALLEATVLGSSLLPPRLTSSPHHR
jgi:hypothetical protein